MNKYMSSILGPESLYISSHKRRGQSYGKMWMKIKGPDLTPTDSNFSFSDLASILLSALSAREGKKLPPREGKPSATLTLQHGSDNFPQLPLRK